MSRIAKARAGEDLTLRKLAFGFASVSTLVLLGGILSDLAVASRGTASGHSTASTAQVERVLTKSAQSPRSALDGMGVVGSSRSFVAMFAQSGPELTGGRREIGAGIFGFSIALSADGKTALIGSPNDDHGIGAAWVYVRSSSGWTPQAMLTGRGRDPARSVAGLGVDGDFGGGGSHYRPTGTLRWSARITTTASAERFGFSRGSGGGGRSRARS